MLVSLISVTKTHSLQYKETIYLNWDLRTTTTKKPQWLAHHANFSNPIISKFVQSARNTTFVPYAMILPLGKINIKDHIITSQIFRHICRLVAVELSFCTRHNDLEIFSAKQTLWEGNPPVIRIFGINFVISPKKLLKLRGKLPFISNALTRMWRHCDCRIEDGTQFDLCTSTSKFKSALIQWFLRRIGYAFVN